MANRFLGKMIIVDTTDTQVGGSTPDIGGEGALRILAIKWVATNAKAIADGNKLTVEWDRNGGDIAIACDAQLAALTGSVIYSVEFSKPWVIPGLYVEDIDGGELQIFLD